MTLNETGISSINHSSSEKYEVREQLKNTACSFTWQCLIWCCAVTTGFTDTLRIVLGWKIICRHVLRRKVENGYKRRRRPAWSDMKMYWRWKIECFVPQYSPVIPLIILSSGTFPLNNTSSHIFIHPYAFEIVLSQKEIERHFSSFLPSPRLCVHKLLAARNTQMLVK